MSTQSLLARARHGLPPGRRFLENPDGLRLWYDALANARYSQARILAAGDSITMGWGATGGAYTLPDMLQRNWVGHLRSLFADRYGDVGMGTLVDDDQHVSTHGGGAGGSPTIGFEGKSATLNSNTKTVTWPHTGVCTTIRVHYWWDDSAANGQATVSIDGGASTTLPTASGTDVDTYHDITGLTSADHSVVITGPSTGAAYIIGIEAISDSTKGVQVNNVGVGGRMLYDAFAFASAAQYQTRLKRQTLGLVSPHLVILSFGANDSNTGQSTNGITPSVYATELDAVVSYAVNTVGAAVLGLGEPRRNPTDFSALTYTDDDYYAQAREVVLSYGGAWLDPKSVFGDYATANARGYYWSPPHPNGGAYAIEGRVVHEAIGIL